MAVDINPIPRHPIWTPRQAVAYARSEVLHPDKDYEGKCLHFCAWTYGFAASNVYDAASFWRGMPLSQRFSPQSAPRVGGLACWLGGSSGHGHIAPIVGYSGSTPMIASNDIRRSGRIDIVPLSAISNEWGQTYVGWTKPYFRFGIADNRRPLDVYEKPAAWGTVYVAKLHEGVKGSDSVRKLQYRLRVNVTGNYNKTTENAADSWLAHHGWKDSKGKRWTNEQAMALFGANYFVKPA